jgi:adenylate cyclase
MLHVYHGHPVRGDNRTRHNREIERKFLVKWLPDNLKRARHFIIEQGYLATESAGRQVRLRKSGSAASLTFKVARSSHREEREIKLGPKQFAALWPGTAGRRLRKVRYEIPWDNVMIEIDIYRGRHAGLVVAEVEFANSASCRRFKAPSWFGREVTGEKRYSNVRLALK